MSPTTLIIAVALTVFCTVALLLAPLLLEPSAEAQNILKTVGRKRDTEAPVEAQETVSAKILDASASLRARLGFAENSKSKKRLIAAGYRGGNANDLFFAVQCLTPLMGAFGASFIPENTFFWVLALGLIGFILPDMWLSRRIDLRKRQLRRSLPDAIDLLVICVDAGLGMDQAVLRVTEELTTSHPQIHEEFTIVNLERRAGLPRLEAWQNLAARTGVEELAAFANMLTQTERFGTPIIKALNRFSEDLRQGRRQRAEEAAAKTKIKIIFPLVMCIFPSLFVVLLAPALLSIMSGLKGLGK